MYFRISALTSEKSNFFPAPQLIPINFSATAERIGFLHYVLFYIIFYVRDEEDIIKDVIDQWISKVCSFVKIR